MCCLNVAMYAGCCACQACAQCCGATIGQSIKRAVRLIYVLFDALYVIIALLLIGWFSDFLNEWQSLVSCPADFGTQCTGVAAIFRMSLGLVILHLFVLFFLLMRNECSKAVNEEIWCFKVFLVTVVFIGAFFIPNTFFQTYSTIAMVFSIFFLLFQIMMIIDLFYLWNESWVARYDNGQECFKYLLIFSFLALYAFDFYLNISLYSWFEGCNGNNTIVTINIVLMVLATLFVILGFNPNGSVMTTGAVWVYSSFLIWSGESSSCPASSSPVENTVQIVFGVVFIVVSLLYVSINTQDNSSGKVDLVTQVLADDDDEDEKDDQEMGESKKKRKEEKKAEKAKKKKELQEKLKQAEDEKKKAELSDYTESNLPIYFHVIMLAGSFYIGILITNWGNSYENSNAFFSTNMAAWVKIGTGFFTNVLYIWTIIAPKLFPDREF